MSFDLKIKFHCSVMINDVDIVSLNPTIEMTRFTLTTGVSLFNHDLC